jgi:hypothetical protein
MGSMAAIKYEPEPAFMRAYCSEVYSKLPLFDDRCVVCVVGSSLRVCCAFVPQPTLNKHLSTTDSQQPTLTTDALNRPNRPPPRDLATALTAFTALKRLAKVDFLGEFLEEVRTISKCFFRPRSSRCAVCSYELIDIRRPINRSLSTHPNHHQP